MMDIDRYGAVTSTDDVGPMDVDQQDDVQDLAGDVGNALWGYINDGRINGVPVAGEDLGLKLDDERMLGLAFVLHRTLKSELLYLSPDGGPGVDMYNELMEEINNGSLEIVDEIRQWDQDNTRFVLWIRYNTLEYKLHPRFSYLREE